MALGKGLTYGLIVAGGIVLGAIGMNYRLNAKMNDMPAMVKNVDGVCMYMDNVAQKQYGCEIVNDGMSVLSDPAFGKAMKVLDEIANKLNSRVSDKGQLEKSVQDNINAIKGLKQ